MTSIANGESGLSVRNKLNASLGITDAISLGAAAAIILGASATLNLAAGSSLITSGANSITFASTGATSVTLPTSGTLATTAGVSAALASAMAYTDASASAIANGSSPLTTPVLGTPTSGTLTNATGLPISSGVSGLGANVAAFLATPSSANLLAALTDETGTGASVFAGSPTFTGTPISPSFSLAGAISAIAWTTAGIGLREAARTLTITSASGTDAAAYTHKLGGNTIGADAAKTITDYYSTFITEPTAGTNVTLTRKWALGLSGRLFATQEGTVSAPTMSIGAHNTGLFTAASGAILGLSTAGVARLAFSGGGFAVKSDMPVGFSAGDPSTTSIGAAFSYIGAGIIAVGTGSIGSVAGTVRATKYQGPGSTSSQPMWEAVGATWAAKKADGSADAAITASTIAIGGGVADPGFFVSTSGGFYSNNVSIQGTGVALASSVVISWSIDTSPFTTVALTLAKLSTSNLRQGSIPSASPVAQIFTLGEASRGGTDSNVASPASKLQAGLGTGNATVGAMLLQVGVVQASGTTQHTYATAISINNSTATGLQFSGYGAGAITSDGSGNLTAASDPRMKHIQREFDAGLVELSRIKPIIYKWRADSGMEPDNEYAGFDAQNVRDTLELATWKGKDGTLSLQDRALLAVCVNSINQIGRHVGLIA